ncbi:MAG: N-acetylneuraminate synthase family protein [Phycisphaerae bacterium]|nr:N-acetylneuraminate synthase family protein [Phycisphaerae bacterium]
MMTVRIGSNEVGPNRPIYIVAEIGINHNGDVNTAKKLIDAAALAGCDAVKFQRRTPELCVPAAMRDVPRETPWGTITYMEYRRRMEFGEDAFATLDRYCREKGIAWFASCFDRPSLDFMERFETPCIKIPSCCLTDDALLLHARSLGRPVVLSTGMSTWEQITHAVDVCSRHGRSRSDLVLLHCTSTYPCPPAELNLRVIDRLRTSFGCPVGYSGHEVGLQTTVAAATLGACFIERHITLDRAMWGSDQAASIEPGGLARLVRDIRVVEQALGDGVKRLYESELPVMKRLRLVGGEMRPLAKAG